MGSAAAVAWLALAALVQLVWGFYPAVLRFLQTRTPHILTSLQLSLLINSCACPTMVLQSICECLYAVGWRRGHAAATAAMREASVHKKPRRRAEAVAAQEGPDSPCQPLLSDSAQEELPAPGSGEEESLAPVGTPSVSAWKKFGILVGTTTALTALMVSQIFALVFVQAYISQMVFLLAPLLVSFLALAVLHAPLPPFFWPTLILMLVGSGMVVGGKAEAAGAAAAAASNSGLLAQQQGLHTVALPGGRLGLLMWSASAVVNFDDVAGVGLSLLSACSLAVFMLTIQVGGKVVSNAEVLWANYPTQALLSLLLTGTLERDKLGVLLQLHAWEWAVVVGVSVAVNWLGNLLQQVTIKQIGAPQVAAFLPLRLVGSLIASYIILSEKLDNAWEGAGAAVVLVTLTMYLYAQKRHADQAAIAQLLEDVATEP